MIRMTLDASRRSLYLTTSTSGLIAFIDSSAESTLCTPTRSVVWMTWRWRLERSTASSSTSPSVPTPAAARGPGRAAPGRGRVEGHGRAEPAGAEQQHLALEQLELPLEADLGHEQVARVALALLLGQRLRDLDLVAAVLPQRDAAGHRGHVLVAQKVPERVRGERRACAGGAVEDDALRTVRDDAVDARLEIAARHVGRARDVARVPLLALAHVDEDHAVAEVRLNVGRVDLVDLALDLADDLRAGRAHGISPREKSIGIPILHEV